MYFSKALSYGIIVFTLLFLIQCGVDHNPEFTENAPEQNFDISTVIEVHSGTMPLVISAPHGGTLSPSPIPDRSCPNITTVRDRNTTELAYDMSEQLYKKYGVRPYIVSALISRRKIDLNRDLYLATCGNRIAMDVWHEYHRQIEVAIDAAVEEFGKVVFIDLHGHGHAVQRLELGYLLSKSELYDSYQDENVAEELGEKSSFRNLLSINEDVHFYDLMFAKDAFGTLMEKSGFPSVPSLDDPFPHSSEGYFNGGYNTRRYTSEEYPEVFGLQIEANFEGVRDSDINRMEFSIAFADAVMQMINRYITDEI
ncbi:MAG: hypothetical protein EA390_02040 [Balneolaceae bacterium]|nr:MAG: hypothetical protein EA390_02040 [Balneolaceae bacterium]